MKATVNSKVVAESGDIVEKGDQANAHACSLRPLLGWLSAG